MKLSNIGKLKKSNLLILICALILFVTAIKLHSLTKKPVIAVSTQESAVNFNILFLKISSFGNKRLLSDMIWTQTLLQSDMDQYKKKDLNNWMFLRFNTISELDPYFYENYLYGGQFLSVVKDDLEGATSLFEKGLRIFPNDYKLNYNAGFTYYFEKGDYLNGLKRMEIIQYNPKAPIYFPSIVNKLKLGSGQLDLQSIFPLVYEQFNSTDDEGLREKLRRDLYSIKAEIDLICLNNNKPGCDNSDFNGTPYIKKRDGFHSSSSFKLYRLKRRGDETVPSQNITTIK